MGVKAGGVPMPHFSPHPNLPPRGGKEQKASAAFGEGMSTLRRYVIQRLVASGLTLLGVSCIIFVMVRLLPGDPARVIAGLLASEDEVTAVRRQLGLDRALYVQYGHFLARAVRGDLGLSARTSEPVVREIMARLPATLKLALISTLLATCLGVVSGVVAATHLYSGFDYLVSLATLFGVSMPVYWLGLILIIVFCAAVPDPGEFFGRAGGTHDALHYARSVGAGVRAYRPSQRAAGTYGSVPSCLAQRPDSHHHCGRAAVWRFARRGSPDRDRIRLAGHGAVAGGIDFCARLFYGSGDRPDILGVLYPDQFPG